MTSRRELGAGRPWFVRYPIVLPPCLQPRLRAAAPDVCRISRLGPRSPPATLGVLLVFAIGSLALFPRLGQDFFPAVDAGQFRMHVRAPAGTRIEETERIFGQVEDAIREVVPDSQRAMILDNMG